MNDDIARRVARLEEIAGFDPGRGIGPLLEATRGDLLSAATSLGRHPAPHVAVVTGFYVHAADPPAAETDGPVGAAHLAAALDRAGVPVRLATDGLCAAALRAAVRAAGVAHRPLDVADDEDGTAGVLAAWEAADPPVSHVISIERVGPSADGTYRSMTGADITAWVAPLDRLFQGGDRLRIGIGDGGNELGMGKLPRDLVASSIPRGDLTGCVVDCEHLLVCGISNWGALALVAALALVRPDRSDALLSGLTPERDRQVLAATVEEGPAVDGMKGKPALSVDNVAWEDQAKVLQRLVAVTARSRSYNPP